jgi:hypothetical protein
MNEIILKLLPVLLKFDKRLSGSFTILFASMEGRAASIFGISSEDTIGRTSEGKDIFRINFKVSQSTSIQMEA